MKKALIFLCFLFLFACSSKTSMGFVSSNGDEIISKVSNKDTFLVMITNDDCYSCDMFIEDSESVLEDNNLVVYTLNYNDINETLLDQLSIALGDYDSWPAIFYVVDGSVDSGQKYEYSIDSKGWETWLVNMKIINK